MTGDVEDASVRHVARSQTDLMQFAIKMFSVLSTLQVLPD